MPDGYLYRVIIHEVNKLPGTLRQRIRVRYEYP